MLCAAIDIGSNTTRLLVAEAEAGRLRKVAEQRAYTQIGSSVRREGRIASDRIGEVADVVRAQARVARELGATAVWAVATAAVRDAANADQLVAEVERSSGLRVDVLGPREEGRLAFLGATKALGHPVDGTIGVVDVGGGSSEIIIGSIAEGAREVHSLRIGSGSLADELLGSDPPSDAELRALRDRIGEALAGLKVEPPDHALAVGGSATSLGRLVGTVLEHETLERAIGVLAGDPIEAVARRFRLDPRRVRLLPAAVLLLEKISDALGTPLRIGEGGLREGVVLDRLVERSSDARGGDPAASSAAGPELP